MRAKSRGLHHMTSFKFKLAAATALALSLAAAPALAQQTGTALADLIALALGAGGDAAEIAAGLAASAGPLLVDVRTEPERAAA